MATYFGYSRVSTRKQDLESQVTYLHSRAQSLGMDFVSVEEQKTAKDYQRQVLDIINKVKPGDILGFYITSRLGRPDAGDEYILMGWAQEVQKRGGKLEISGQVIDTRNASDAIRLFLELMQAGADYANIVRNTKRGRESKRLSGDYLAPMRYMTYGYTRVPGQRRLEVNLAESEIIKLIFKLANNGKSPYQIAKHLNTKGILTKNNKTWGRTSILLIVHNSLYMGYVLKKEESKFKKIRHLSSANMGELAPANNYPPLLTQEAFWGAVKSFKEHVPSKVAQRRLNAGLFTGRIHCWHCRKAGKRIVLTYAKMGHTNSPFSVYRFLLSLPNCPSPKTYLESQLTAIFGLAMTFTFSDTDAINSFFEERIKSIRGKGKEEAIAKHETNIVKFYEEIDTWKANIAKVRDANLISSWLKILEEIEEKVQTEKRAKDALMEENKEEVIQALRLQFSQNNFINFFSESLTKQKQILSNILNDCFCTSSHIVFRFKNSYTLTFGIPNKVGRTYQNEIVFHAIFRGYEQYRGTVNLSQGEILNLEVPLWIKSDAVREVMAENTLLTINNNRELVGAMGQMAIAMEKLTLKAQEAINAMPDGTDKEEARSMLKRGKLQ